ncbi:MAG: chorismate-binding protein [Gammaproteobacteria bacterium]|nr:chorismate-binding protein [Gammaproteobacteria bacterium]
MLPVPAPDETWVLLESARPDRENRYSYFFRGPLREILLERPEEAESFLETLEDLRGRYWLAGYLTFELAYALEPRLNGSMPSFDGPLAWFGVFGKPHIFDHATGAWSPEPPTAQSAHRAAAPGGDGSCADVEYSPRISPGEYAAAYSEIQNWLREGETYQVNFTFPGTCRSALPALELYSRLREAQRVPYSALLQHGDRTVLSLSPELFFRVEGNAITTRPMKGTAPRGFGAREDGRRRRGLRSDPKNRAENLMIVDLLRNDLGRVCTAGSIRVPHLFRVEAHRTLLQMTSTITGTLGRQWTLPSLLRALYPCGSVTGAPKLHTLELIAGIETGPRGVYCGAIGFTAPDGRCTFNVPIRTLERHAGERHWRFHTGSGVVHGADAGMEWRECLNKASFLTTPTPTFELLETLRLDGTGITHADAHRRRLAASARYWAFEFDRRAWERLIGIIREHAESRPQMVRILLDREGRLRWERIPLADPAAAPPAVRLNPEPVDPENPHLYHKSTWRPWYADTLARIRAGEIFDEIFLNTRGELTEGARTNLFVRIEGALFTPPVECGLLPGILRAALLRAGECRERVLRPGDLERAEAIYCGNSVRGLVRVRRVAPLEPGRHMGTIENFDGSGG